MEYIQLLANQITQRNEMLDRHDVKKVLILYEEKVFFLGDTCLRFDKFRYCRLFFENANVHLNIESNKFLSQYKALLEHNPYIDQVETVRLEELAYHEYDAVICVIPDEGRLLSILAQKYGPSASAEPIRFAVFSLSSFYINQDKSLNVLPKYDALVEFYKGYPDNDLHELYIDAAERANADAWLEKNGVKEKEEVFVFLDSSAKREKLLRMDVYFSIVKALLERPRTKVLIFDEKNIGKEAFYREWLGKDLSSKLIFSKKLALREDLALLASGYIKMIFGPCTGLLHCAAGIFNRYLKERTPACKVPILITYTGKYERPGESAADWWTQCPLVTCLLLKNRQGMAQVIELSALPPRERTRTDDVLPCKEYSSAMLLTVITRKLEKLQTVQNVNV